MGDFTIKTENIMDPPEKMRLMYEAVSELLREKSDMRTLKVQDITARAGIGKGTAYEYFSSKEELLAHALLYEYSNKIRALVESVFELSDFRGRIYRVMDWISENREYHHVLIQTFQMAARASGVEPPAMPPGEGDDCPLGELRLEAYQYIYRIADRLMEDGYKEGIFTETSAEKRRLAVLTGMCEYGVTLMFSGGHHCILQDDGELRRFVYDSIVKTLN